MLKVAFRSGWAAARGLLLAASLSGCQRPAPAPGPGPIARLQSDKSDRRAVAITIYNQNFGLVRESRRLALRRGHVELAFKDVPAHIQPETVQLRGLTPGARFELLEQDYRYDLLTPSKLLEKHVGRTINVYRYDPTTGTETKKRAEVLGVEGGVTLRIDGEITSGFDGRFGFEQVPRELLEKPTLVWRLESDRAEQDVEVSYLTRNLSWRADYVLELDESDRRANLTAWVSLENQSGVSYENATLRLVAGDVNRAPASVEPQVDAAAESFDDAAGNRAGFREQALFEYHLYTLERPTTLLDKELKQVSLLSAEDVAVTKKLRVVGAPELIRLKGDGTAARHPVGVYVELTNSAENRLGVPLPRGVVRLYKADASFAPQFLGEDAIEHTPRDEKLSLKVGEAFDVVAERTQKSWAQLDRCLTEAAFELELRNHKSSAVQVEVSEPVGGDWEVRAHDHPFVKVDQHTLRFDVDVPARSSTKLSYRLAVRYC